MSTNIMIAVPIDENGLKTLQEDSRFDVNVSEYLFRKREIKEFDISKVEVCFTSQLPDNHEEMKALKWVQIDSAGYSHLFDHQLVERGVKVTNALGNFDIPIAEWNIAMMINLLRDTKDMIHNQDRAQWVRTPRHQQELRGSTVGFYGYGGIARETSRLAKVMGLNIHVLARNGVKARDLNYVVPGTGDPKGVLPDRVYSMDEKTEFLKSLDFLIVSMPLTKVNEGCIGEDELKTLPDHAFVLNPSRGPLIQEQALIHALSENWIAGAALDTHHQYPPPPDHPLWKMDNVIMTPHISGSTESTNFTPRSWDIFTTNLDRYLKGEALLNELSEDQLQGN